MKDPVKERDEHMRRVQREREALRQEMLRRDPRSPVQVPEQVDFNKLANEMRAHAKSDPPIDPRWVRADRLKSSGIASVILPEDFDWLVNDELPLNTHALRTVKRWINVRNGGRRAATMLVMFGETGRGKTVAVAYLIAELGGFYCTMEDLVISRSSRDRSVYERALVATVLHVDELFTESDEGRGAGALFELLNRRAGLEHGWTALTGNPPPPDEPLPSQLDAKESMRMAKKMFAERYGLRTLRRLEHQGEFVLVGGEDLRRKGKGGV
jgi:hypothetical protein